LSNQVVITDVGPRDGLQNQKKILSISERAELIYALGRSGIPGIEVGSFVSPRAVPAMAGTDKLVDDLNKTKSFQTPIVALVPNLKGYHMAREAGMRHVVMVVYGSDAMAKKNVAMSKAEAEKNIEEIMAEAARDGIDVTATVAVAFECPFEGKIEPVITERIVERLIDMGAANVVLADTIGAAHPRQVGDLTTNLVQKHGFDILGCHFHDTRGLGVANVYAALQAGIRRFDSSIAGLGGCPFAPGASGNVATEDVVLLCKQMGFATGIDISELLIASERAARLTETDAEGRSTVWLRDNHKKLDL